MSTYLDLISFENQEIEETDDYLLPVDEQNQLLTILFSHQDFIIMSMNIKALGTINIQDLQNNILFLYRNCNGIADIRQTIYTVLSAIEDIELVQNSMPVLQPMLDKLIAKYEDK